MKPDDVYSAEETARRRDDAIRRALSTPPKPHKEMSGKGKRDKSVGGVEDGEKKPR